MVCRAESFFEAFNAGYTYCSFDIWKDKVCVREKERERESVSVCVACGFVAVYLIWTGVDVL